MNFFVLQLLTFALFVSSSFATLKINYRCPGLKGYQKEYFDVLMTVLIPQEEALIACMETIYKSKDRSGYITCINNLNLPERLQTLFKTGLPVVDMRNRINNVVKNICQEQERIASETPMMVVFALSALGIIVLLNVIGFVVFYIRSSRHNTESDSNEEGLTTDTFISSTKPKEKSAHI